MSVDPLSPDDLPPWSVPRSDADPHGGTPLPSENSNAGNPPLGWPAQSELQTPPAPPPMIACRRCGKSTPANRAKCVYCEARLPPLESPGVPYAGFAQTEQVQSSSIFSSRPETEIDQGSATTRLLIFYVLLLSTNILGRVMAEAGIDEHTSRRVLTDRVIATTVFVELLDVVIVLAALFTVPWPPKIGPQSLQMKRIGWLTGPLVLAVLLGLNFLYHHLLQGYVQFPQIEHEHLQLPIAFTFLCVCVQPGIIEELFFRFIALGTLSRIMGIAGALCVSSLMFGMAHSGVVLSIPILTVVGFGLGMVRVFSGSIVLPMLLHALHNAVVIYLEAGK
jgi:hypothetical protein